MRNVMFVVGMGCLWLGGALFGAGMRGRMIHDEYINECMESNFAMPHGQVRKFCEDKLEAVKLPPKE